jgi:hypothetical protein
MADPETTNVTLKKDEQISDFDMKRSRVIRNGVEGATRDENDINEETRDIFVIETGREMRNSRDGSH